MMNSKTSVPRIILGTMNFGRQFDEAVADRMLGSFIDRGYKEIDTAYSYADGAAEEILGRVLTLERRGKVYLATKVNPLEGGGLAVAIQAFASRCSIRRTRGCAGS